MKSRHSNWDQQIELQVQCPLTVTAQISRRDDLKSAAYLSPYPSTPLVWAVHALIR